MISIPGPSAMCQSQWHGLMAIGVAWTHGLLPGDRDWQCVRCDRKFEWTDLTWMRQHVLFQVQSHGPWPGSWIAESPWRKLDVKVCADCADLARRTMWRTRDGLAMGCSCDDFLDIQIRGVHFYKTTTGG